ncbi:aryl-sulfate sulfotransferase [Rubrivirga marina]|uniref:Arylsulfotransferase N-terminal domain-containing protein n=1 Tax=Rubrivirga marina TaxID=1196024 RepID=A0A271IZT3_9BACT|nr:aryl-sulfate sulfotransferase [Rubrivirga marina]PAP76751.1 hypothetical protein BSZ37_10055 [Rubrivirga marina]
MLTRSVLVLLLLGLGVAGCDGARPEPPDETDALPAVVSRFEVEVDPAGTSPLTAEVTLEADVPVSIDVVVEGKEGAATEIRHRFDDLGTVHRIPVLGLYANTTTAVTLVLRDESGAEVGRVERDVETGRVPGGLPAVTVNTAAPGAVRPGLTFVSSFAGEGATPQAPFAYDAAGTIRWVLDYSGRPPLTTLFYDNGIDRLANGNLYFGDGATDRIYEVDLFGRIVRQWDLPGFGFHHHVLEKPDGNFLVTVNRDGAATVEDAVVEVDRETGQIVRDWDLRQSLNQYRRAWPTDLADLNVDWFHANALVYDERDDTILVSGRTQGLVKLTAGNEVVWILAPHRDWGTAGDGTDLATKLLQPLDAAGQPITDPAVLDGAQRHVDFDWAWYQHAPEILPDGSILLFDNGDSRGYTGRGLYSRAVVYRVHEAAMTVRQVWDYGEERGPQTYSRIVSDVDYHADEGIVVFAPGAIARGEANPHGRVVEVDRATGAVRSEAVIRAPTTRFGITFHRVERMPLYPPGLRTTRPNA